ncbi:hypothetical protein ACIQC5_21475 [Paenarthrobacter sp. NPDC092416]|uniref:hypothetical protein n=1 Tax=Paenarthrobacter sp. NPDC092416 TaxID=3364386 RepID=UPI0037F4F16E
MADPAQVFVEDLGGFGQIDVGLFSTTDRQDVGALNQGVAIYDGMLACGAKEP